MRRGINSIDGDVSIDTRPGGGTTVTFTVPRLTQMGTLAPPTEALTMLDASPMGRFGLLGTNIFMLLVTWPLSRGLPAPDVVMVAVLGFVVVNGWMGWSWSPRSRWIAPLLALALAAVALLAPVISSPSGIGCAAAGDSAWLILGLSGGGVLLMLSAVRRIAARLGIVGVMGSLTVILAWAVDPACRAFPMLAAVVCVLYMVAITGFVTWLDLRFDVARRQRMVLWQEITAGRAELAGRQVAAERWSRLTDQAQDLLRDVATGSVDVASPSVRARAATQSSDLRARLGSADRADSLRALVEDVLPVALDCGVALESSAITPGRRTDPWPGWVRDMLAAAVRAQGDRPGERRITVTGMHDQGYDEVLVSVDSTEGLAAALRCVPADPGDVVVAQEPGRDGDVTVLIVRRAAR